MVVCRVEDVYLRLNVLSSIKRSTGDLRIRALQWIPALDAIKRLRCPYFTLNISRQPKSNSPGIYAGPQILPP